MRGEQLMWQHTGNAKGAEGLGATLGVTRPLLQLPWLLRTPLPASHAWAT